MAIISQNGNSAPMPRFGSAIQNGNYKNGPYLPIYYGYSHVNSPSFLTASISSLNQVAGLVPVFNCTDPECRNGKYGSNDHNFMLPAFAENQTSTWGDYKNDFRPFLFDIPSNSALTDSNYYLDVYQNGSWVEYDTLDDDTYGFYYPVGRICDKNYFTGYNILWNKVLNIAGEGIYRFRVGLSTGTFTESVNHFKIVGFKTGGTVELISVGYGLICPTFTINSALSFAVNMQNLVAWINTYQATASSTPAFNAVYNSGTGQIDIFGLLGQNCPCSALVTDVSYLNYAQSFSGGVDTLQVLACYASPPFCLKTWDCWAVNSTTRFDAKYSGGVIGNIDKSKPGTIFSFCCSGMPTVYPDKKSLFTIKFWAQGIVYVPVTFTFTMDYGYDLVNPVTFGAGTTYIQMAQQLTTAINAHQATLGTPQFSAYYNPISHACEITNLFGQNITFTMVVDGAATANTIQWTFNSLVTVLPTTGGNHIWIGQFNGGTNINAQTFSFSTPIVWRDSVRVGGEFGYEQTEYERKSIKYQTGLVNKIRDELILKHIWKSSSLPFWFHERFKAYGLMADELKVSDYNMNNSDYNIKLYSVQGDSSYNPKYKNHPRETIVECEFKPALQNLKRNRCC